MRAELAHLEGRYAGDLLEGETVAGGLALLREECRAAYLAVLRRLVAGFAAMHATDNALRYGLCLALSFTGGLIPAAVMSSSVVLARNPRQINALQGLSLIHI